MIAAACRMYIQLFFRRHIVNKKYMLCRIYSLLLYAVGTVIWIICVLKPWKFMWTIGISITVIVYALMIVASLILAQKMKGRLSMSSKGGFESEETDCNSFVHCEHP